MRVLRPLTSVNWIKGSSPYSCEILAACCSLGVTNPVRLPEEDKSERLRFAITLMVIGATSNVTKAAEALSLLGGAMSASLLTNVHTMVRENVGCSPHAIPVLTPRNLGN